MDFVYKNSFSTFFFPIHFHLFWDFEIEQTLCSEHLPSKLRGAQHLGLCRRNGEAAAIAVCFVWWLYYRTILLRRRLGSCSSCTLCTPGSFFYLSFLSQQPISSFASFLPSFVLWVIWIGMQEVRRGETVQRWWWWWWLLLLLRLLFLSFFFTVAPPFRVSCLVLL